MGTLDGKTCLVTGATSGIGLVTAEALARLGARIALIGRDPARVAAAVEGIKARTGNARVEGLVGDLSSFAEVRRLADEFRARADRLDVLVNNAGGIVPEKRLSADGIEMTLALNHFSYFLLTNSLLDLLKAAAPARVVSVASDAHRIATKVDEANLKGPEGFAGWRAYGESKLANILFSNELARRLGGTGVTSNALHPGVVATRFFEGKGGIFYRLAGAMARIGASRPERGAETSIYLASSPEVEGVTGRYFAKSKQVEPSPAARDEAAARRLWDLSAEWTGLASA